MRWLLANISPLSYCLWRGITRLRFSSSSVHCVEWFPIRKNPWKKNLLGLVVFFGTGPRKWLIDWTSQFVELTVRSIRLYNSIPSMHYFCSGNFQSGALVKLSSRTTTANNGRTSGKKSETNVPKMVLFGGFLFIGNTWANGFKFGLFLSQFFFCYLVLRESNPS